MTMTMTTAADAALAREVTACIAADDLEGAAAAAATLDVMSPLFAFGDTTMPALPLLHALTRHLLGGAAPASHLPSDDTAHVVLTTDDDDDDGRCARLVHFVVRRLGADPDRPFVYDVAERHRTTRRMMTSPYNRLYGGEGGVPMYRRVEGGGYVEVTEEEVRRAQSDAILKGEGLVPEQADPGETPLAAVACTRPRLRSLALLRALVEEGGADLRALANKVPVVRMALVWVQPRWLELVVAKGVRVSLLELDAAEDLVRPIRRSAPMSRHYPLSWWAQLLTPQYVQRASATRKIERTVAAAAAVFAEPFHPRVLAVALRNDHTPEVVRQLVEVGRVDVLAPQADGAPDAYTYWQYCYRDNHGHHRWDVSGCLGDTSEMHETLLDLEVRQRARLVWLFFRAPLARTVLDANVRRLIYEHVVQTGRRRPNLMRRRSAELDLMLASEGLPISPCMRLNLLEGRLSMTPARLRRAQLVMSVEGSQHPHRHMLAVLALVTDGNAPRYAALLRTRRLADWPADALADATDVVRRGIAWATAGICLPRELLVSLARESGLTLDALRD
jgi:hypothetical protein